MIRVIIALLATLTGCAVDVADEPVDTVMEPVSRQAPTFAHDGSVEDCAPAPLSCGEGRTGFVCRTESGPPACAAVGPDSWCCAGQCAFDQASPACGDDLHWRCAVPRQDWTVVTWLARRSLREHYECRGVEDGACCTPRPSRYASRYAGVTL